MALTKQDELLKYHIDENLDTPKIEITPKLVDNALHICTPKCVHLESNEIALQPKRQMTNTKMTAKTQLEKITNKLYNLENCQTTEKILNIDLDLYQMDDL
ncbi:MAG: hypothetical protein LBE76_06380 [Nitrososphaerota archaeon]|jgi:hypothetical protein|nr:hypothetical protein [Nitrososphaerota archaeon]